MSEILFGFCECGCGEKTRIAKKTRPKYGHIKGEPVRFLPGHQSRGVNHYAWKGERKRDSNGYWRVWCLGHPRENGGYVHEHILMAEKALGKPLPPNAVVHHANGDNEINESNIVICNDATYHRFIERRLRVFKECGHANWLRCCYCKRLDDPSKLYIPPGSHWGYHRSCYNTQKTEYRHKRKVENALPTL